MRRWVAVLSLASIFTCSGLGLCWKEFVPRAHDCCQRESAKAPAKACASEAQRLIVASVVAPSIPAAVLTPVLRVETAPRQTAAFFPVQPPELVLRI
jgi:hypothetical protein